MILEFSVKNFLSFDQMENINFVATKDKSNKNNLTETPFLPEKNILKSAVIYGANASGKSNLVKAFLFCINFIKSSIKHQEGDLLNYKPFKLNNKYKETTFQIIFVVEKIKYVYRFSYNKTQITEEYLYYYPKGRQSILFERDETDQYNFTKDEKELNLLAKRTLQNRLFISVASEWKYEKIMKPFAWLKENIVVKLNELKDNWLQYTANLVKTDPIFKKNLNELLKKADFGISDMNVEILDEVFNEKKLKLKTIHKIQDKNKKSKFIEFDINEESLGTRKLFELYGPLYDILKNGKILIIDEIELNLHTFLTEYLVSKFHDKKINKNNAQLIFTTHDTNLLDLDLFRRDQIWFTKKRDEDSSTELYSLAEIKNVRNNENIQKGYKNNKYGALPYKLMAQLRER